MQHKPLGELPGDIRQFVLKDFRPRVGEVAGSFPANAAWARLRELGSDLWLDTGDIDAAGELWTAEFTALTTNNTLLNREVQKGVYDEAIPRIGELLDRYDLDERGRTLERAFVLNAMHALRLVERFDAHVSVEEHTDLAHDVDRTVETARRYHEICPERFIVKVPLTPAGILATRRLAREGIAVNHTLGFSARQNYVVTRLAGPAFVNVFLGRLNSFVADNGLGDGQYVGERATLASQAQIRRLRDSRKTPTRQIGASFRAGEQVCNLAGVDVLTMPPKVARQFLDLGIPPGEFEDRTGKDYEATLADGVDCRETGLATLWDVGPEVAACLDDLEKEDLDRFSPGDLVTYFADHGCGDLLVDWSEPQVATSAEEGKIPRMEHWKAPLAGGEIGLDALMNLAGLNSFIADQKAMDEKVRQTLSGEHAHK